MTGNATPPPTPEIIEKLADGAMAAFAMLAGMQLDLFTPLKDGPKSAVEIADTIGADPDKLSLLLHALVAAEMLTVDGGLFSNTSESNHYLVNSEPTYIGGARQSFFVSRWQEASLTAESVRTGKAQSKLDFGAMSTDDLEVFLRGLNPGAIATGRSLAQRVDFSNYSRMLEVGAGLGGVTLGVAEAFPDLEVVLADFPAVAAIAEKVIAETGMSDRVSAMSADATADSLGGPFDVAVMKAFIQVLGRDEIPKALDNIARSMKPQGDLYIIGRVLDDSRVEPIPAVLFNVTFLNVYDGGQAYTKSEHESWLTEAGFEDVQFTLLPAGDSIVSARRSAE
jgi:predicted O-methyltransferase YrrM